jgi:hypothetical protein
MDELQEVNMSKFAVNHVNCPRSVFRVNLLELAWDRARFGRIYSRVSQNKLEETCYETLL